MHMITLNFHGVGPLTRPVDPGERACWLETNHFEAILDRVRGDDRVCLTFDDGNASDWEIVMPALLARRMKAAFFICSGRLGVPTFLDEGHVRDLVANGMEVGSHGVNHLPWRTLGDEELRNELCQSRDEIQNICGMPVNTAACPFGSYDRRVLNALVSAGYRMVFTSDGGPYSPGSSLQARNTVKVSTSIDQIDQMLARMSSPAWRLTSGIRTTLKRLRPGSPPAGGPKA